MATEQQLPSPDQIEAAYRKIRFAVLYSVVLSLGTAALLYFIGMNLWWVMGVIFVIELFTAPLLLRTVRRGIDLQVEQSRGQMQAAGKTIYPDVGV